MGQRTSEANQVTTRPTRKTIRLRRDGVSLLEVLISIFTALVGLLGVAALMPLAIYYLARGSTMDNAAAFGRSAISDFKSRHMQRQNAWAIWNPGVGAFVPFQPNPAVIPPTAPAGPLALQAASFCLDGLYVSRAVRDGNLPSNLFPAVPTTAPDEARMARVTLRSRPGVPPITPLSNPNPLFALPYTSAEQIFMVTDQHNYTLPRDRTLPPIPEISTFVDPNGVVQPEKRQFNPALSWFATLTPIVSANGGFPQSDLYTLSVVVVESRDLRTDTTQNLSDEPIERVVDVFFHSITGPTGNPIGDWGAGSVVFMPRPGRPESDLNVRPGTWVMLAGRLIDLNSGNLGAGVFRWYRVLSADRDSSTLSSPTGLYPAPPAPGQYREVVLHGVDWNPNLVARTQAVLVSGVVAVFEKTVRMETSSLWTR